MHAYCSRFQFKHQEMLLWHFEFTGLVPVELLCLGFLFVLGVVAVWAYGSRQRIPLPVHNRVQVERLTYGQSTDVRRRAAYLAQEDELQRNCEYEQGPQTKEGHQYRRYG